MPMDLKNPVWIPGRTKDQIFKQMLYECLVYYKGNKTKVSKVLGICVRTIRIKVQQYKFVEFTNYYKPFRGTEKEVIEFFRRQDELFDIEKKNHDELTAMHNVQSWNSDTIN